jgi:hypothetical protein
MTELALVRKERSSRLVQRADNAFCVALFFAASMPAIIVMLLIAFPLLPLFGVWVSWVASTGGPTESAGHEEPGAGEAGRVDQPPGHAPPTPRFA